jgi:hypothetical protein
LAIGYWLSAIGYRLLAIAYRLSPIGYRLSAIGYWLFPHPANQRTKNTLADGSYRVYACDSPGQLPNGCKYFPTGALRSRCWYAAAGVPGRNGGGVRGGRRRSRRRDRPAPPLAKKI